MNTARLPVTSHGACLGKLPGLCHTVFSMCCLHPRAQSLLALRVPGATCHQDPIRCTRTWLTCPQPSKSPHRTRVPMATQKLSSPGTRTQEPTSSSPARGEAHSPPGVLMPYEVCRHTHTSGTALTRPVCSGAPWERQALSNRHLSSLSLIASTFNFGTSFSNFSARACLCSNVCGRE